MMHQLQDPTHVVPSIIVGLMLSSGWEVAYNADQEPIIRHIRNPDYKFSTWWDALTDAIKLASEQ